MTYEAAHAKAGMSPARMAEFNSNNTPACRINIPDYYMKYAEANRLGNQPAKPVGGGRRSRGRGSGRGRGRGRGNDAVATA